MKLEIANAPVSWGVEQANDDRNPEWGVFLDELLQSGYRWLELGPIGYLPVDNGPGDGAISDRGLRVIAGYVYEPLTEPGLEDYLLAQATASAAAVSALGGRYIVVIDKMNRERMATAGRSDAARRASEAEFQTLIANIERISAVAADHGLRPVFHPHVGSFVEFADEIEKCADALDPHTTGFCLDTGHSAYAGLDAVDLYEQYVERVEYFHFKDVDGGTRERVVDEQLGWDDAVAAGIFTPLGTGTVDFALLREALERHNFEGWATVEQDTEPGNYGDARSAAEASLRFLEDVRLVS